MIELGAIIPGVVLAYLPIKKHLKLSKLRLFPVMILSLVCLCTLCGFVCYRYNLKSFVLAIPIVLALSAAYCCSLKTSMWKSVSVLLAVCGVFACIASITRAVDSITFPQNTTPWFEIKSAVLFNILCWIFVIIAWYPATHGVSELLDDENIAQTWYEANKNKGIMFRMQDRVESGKNGEHWVSFYQTGLSKHSYFRQRWRCPCIRMLGQR